MVTPTTQQINDGQKIYTPLLLKLYDFYVLIFSNRFAWGCDRQKILEFYNQNITAHHLDIGVGTGYFLNHCRFPVAQPTLALLDINENCLLHTNQLLKRYSPKTYCADIYQPLTMVDDRFESIGLNYVLHCLPGTFKEKSKVIANIKPLLRENGVLFGSTILAKNQKHNWLGKKLLNLYNQKGIFSNWEDGLDELEAMLKMHFKQVSIKVVGRVAFFVAK